MSCEFSDRWTDDALAALQKSAAGKALRFEIDKFVENLRRLVRKYEANTFFSPLNFGGCILGGCEHSRSFQETLREIVDHARLVYVQVSVDQDLRRCLRVDIAAHSKGLNRQTIPILTAILAFPEGDKPAPA